MSQLYVALTGLKSVELFDLEEGMFQLFLPGANLHNRLEALALPSNCTEKGVIKLLD
jgi:hypothetical protein